MQLKFPLKQSPISQILKFQKNRTLTLCQTEDEQLHDKLFKVLYNNWKRQD